MVLPTIIPTIMAPPPRSNMRRPCLSGLILKKYALKVPSKRSVKREKEIERYIA